MEMGTNTIEGHIESLLRALRNRNLECTVECTDKSGLLSLVDVIRISILKKAAKIGLNSIPIEVLDRSFQQNTKLGGIYLSVLENRIIEALVGGDRFVSFTPEGKITGHANSETLISIDMGALVNSNFPGLGTEKQDYQLIHVRSNEKKALDMLRDNRYHTVKFYKKGRELNRAESEEKLPPGNRIIDIIKGAAFQDIEIKQESGKPVYINRIIKTKF